MGKQAAVQQEPLRNHQRTSEVPEAMQLFPDRRRDSIHPDGHQSAQRRLQEQACRRHARRNADLHPHLANDAREVKATELPAWRRSRIGVGTSCTGNPELPRRPEDMGTYSMVDSCTELQHNSRQKRGGLESIFPFQMGDRSPFPAFDPSPRRSGVRGRISCSRKHLESDFKGCQFNRAEPC